MATIHPLNSGTVGRIPELNVALTRVLLQPVPFKLLHVNNKIDHSF